jgi:putative CocE/NonD family hydrolase
MRINKTVSFLLLFLLILSSISYSADEYTFQKNVMIQMRDGVKLAANIFIPKAEGTYPTILVRTPYGKGDENSGHGKTYGSNGYAVVMQDCRGRGDSEGIWDPFLYDVKDGFDTQEWIGQQPWSNGTIGTSGGSYVGYTQWASAAKPSKYLTCMTPLVPFSNAYKDIAYIGGAYQLALGMSWGGMMGAKIDIATIQWDKVYTHLPLQTWDDVIGQKVFYLRDWIAHPSYDEYWKKRGIDDRFQDVTVPSLNIGGWYDIFSKATIEQTSRVRAASKNVAVRRNHFTIMGPWTHGISPDGKVGEMNFGKDSFIDINKKEYQWNEYWLKGKNTGVQDWPPYSIFVMGINQWRSEYEWPLARTKYTKCYLHSQGKANTLNGDGILNYDIPAVESNDTYTYDPENPVPTQGGNNLFGTTAGPYDQQKIEERKDVLVYTSETLNEPVEVTGLVTLVLYASTSAKDTDFTGKLVDVHPDGRAINLCEGILRARYRESITEPTLIEPGKVYRYEIDLWVTSNVFLPGHQIRLEVSSSNFPRFDRNPNSGKTFGSDTELLKAEQTIYHTKEYPSHLVLPVIPNSMSLK